jgi:nitric oxide reductase NorQ protein
MTKDLSDFCIHDEPYYRATGNEISLYEHAYAHRMPLILKGPTGCGKTRFVEHMAWRLNRPLITIACNEDMTASDLVGRYLLDADGTAWHDGPLTLAVRHGAICYLDEGVEARQDTTVVIHPLTDARRILPLDKKGEVVHAHADFQLVVSYNPGYQSSSKDMKASTRQRFAALEFDFPDEATETEIVAHETGVEREIAAKLVGVARRSRALKTRGLDEGVSTRMLIYAGTLIRDGVDARDSCDMTMTRALTDDPDMAKALHGFVEAYF